MNDTTTTSNWSDDVLQREEYSRFLTNHLASHFASDNNCSSKTLTFALDSGWGGGKTFFVDRWMQDLQQLRHPVLKFDAWMNDFSTEPCVAFMSTLSLALNPYIKNLPQKAKREQAARKLQDATKSLRKGFLPAAKVIGAGVLKKVTGVAIDELSDAFTDGNLELDDESLEKLKAGSQDALEKGLDAYFQKVLRQHQDVAKSKQQFKKNLQELVALLVKDSAYKLPFVVFVDELDRARPDYAIKLLEEIKHLFGVPGICFCISTNLSQLTHSIKSVYGTGFDGYKYLKRFFDFEFSLPEPDYLSYAKLLMKEMPQSIKSAAYLKFLTSKYSDDGIFEKAFAVICEMFALDLRSQEQVFWMTRAALNSCLETKQTLHPIYMMFLCALRHHAPDAYERLQRIPKLKSEEKPKFVEILQEEISKYPNVKRDYVDREGQHAEEIALLDLLYCYFWGARQELNDLKRQAYEDQSQKLLSQVKLSIAESGVWKDKKTGTLLTVLAPYADLVRIAGQMTMR